MGGPCHLNYSDGDFHGRVTLESFARQTVTLLEAGGVDEVCINCSCCTGFAISPTNLLEVKKSRKKKIVSYLAHTPFHFKMSNVDDGFGIDDNQNEKKSYLLACLE